MTGLNFSRNQQFAILAMVGLSLLGLSYGRLRSARPAAVCESAVTITDRANGGNVEVIAPAPKRSWARDEVPSVVVHVAGCVKHPRVYTLRPGSRIVDAIHAAGGPTRDANLNAINLAAKVRDGERIAVPSKRATPPPAISFSSTSPSGRRAGGAAPSGKLTSPEQGTVNINTAGLDELQRLPGVGPVTAQRIIDYRNQIGSFTSVEQLDGVKGIGPKKLEKMRPFVTL